MTRLTYQAFLTCTLVALTLCVADSHYAHAAGLEFRMETQYVLEAAEQEDRELWLLAEEITVHGEMRESLIALAERATLSGGVAHDLSVLAGDIHFDGHIARNARFGAARVAHVEGRIDGSLLSIAAQTVKLEETAVVQQDAVLAAPDVIVLGNIGGNLSIRAKSAVINGHIDGNVHIRAAEIRILRNTRIGGNLTYISPHELVLDRGVLIAGEVERGESARAGTSTAQWLLLRFYLFGGAWVAGLIFLAAFPRYTGHAVRRIRHTFWNSALAGSLAFFLIPAAAALVFLTLIGIPAGLILVTAYLILLYLAKVVAGLALGSYIMQRRGPQPFATAALSLSFGLLLLYFLASLPIVGSIVTVAILFIGLGGLILGLADVQYGQRPPPLQDKKVDDGRTRNALSQQP